ncbi:hypothetical protein CYMTET_15023 [Cymbomonas tetramitiformis]|uniref:EGF-like domain-containing protein n=1 Tax=Cymbomonas tetramitiformis TaxID=36881 RepID=A0AAE0L9K3_9CHLO|nr:hypothetical protein CYMTET_15023 [Cymbomonas tetramitiformis]
MSRGSNSLVVACADNIFWPAIFKENTLQQPLHRLISKGVKYTIMFGGRFFIRLRTHNCAFLVVALLMACQFEDSEQYDLSCAAISDLGDAGDTCDAECSLTTVSVLNSTAMSCPSRCICGDLSTEGETFTEVVQLHERRCYHFRALDRENFLVVDVAPVSPNDLVVSYLRTGTGPEGHPRVPTDQFYDYTFSSSVETGEAQRFELSRDAWRASNARRDEGEWVGAWTLCVQGTATHLDAPIGFTIQVGLSMCPLSEDYGECSNHGHCERKARQCEGLPHGHLCHTEQCVCNEGYTGRTCSSQTSAPENSPDTSASSTPPVPPSPPPLSPPAHHPHHPQILPSLRPSFPPLPQSSSSPPPSPAPPQPSLPVVPSQSEGASGLPPTEMPPPPAEVLLPDLPKAPAAVPTSDYPSPSDETPTVESNATQKEDNKDSEDIKESGKKPFRGITTVLIIACALVTGLVLSKKLWAFAVLGFPDIGKDKGKHKDGGKFIGIEPKSPQYKHLENEMV